MGNAAHNTYIAVIEDDPSLSRSLARFLRASGYQPVCYGNAEAFLADTKHPVFDCLIVDIQLDGMSGLELVDQLAGTEGSKVSVIFLTADENADALEQSLRSRCVAFLRKSDQGDLLLAAIDGIANV